jgi:hypothetical protein
MTKLKQTKKEILQGQAQNIKNVEARIKELEDVLRVESNIPKKILMQHSLKVNKEILKQMKEEYWKEDK